MTSDETLTRADAVADTAIKHGATLFDKMLVPVFALLDKAKSLEEIKKSFEDEERLKKLVFEMDAAAFEGLLQKALLLADMEGRVINDG